MSDFALMQPDELTLRLGDPSLRLFDTTVRMARTEDGRMAIESGASSYAERHIPGAAFLDLMGEFSAPHADLHFMLPSAERFAAAAGAAGIDASTHVVLYNSGPTWWSTRVWFMLREFGFDRAQVLDGGLDRWVSERRAVDCGIRKYAPTTFEIRARRQVFVGKTDVQAALTANDTTVVNALSADVHAGRSQAYARRGRIPGSCHLFALDLLDRATQSFLPIDELRRRLAAAGLLADLKVIAYCGGGISATTNAFALWLVGKRDVQIYDGSLSEWTRDPTLPLEVDAG
jgi:thiosulfate/3-mercaptopyruvate sulfurtransferase